MSKTNGNSVLSPELKGWLDNVVIPGLVREYLTRLECEKSLAPSAEPAVDSPPAHTAIVEEER